MPRLPLVVVLLGLVALLGLAGCRSEPSVAAYVGDIQVSTEQLADAIDERMADPNIAAIVEPGDPDYQRRVLDQLVQQAIYRIIAADYDISIADSAVDDRLAELLGDSNPQIVTETYARIAADQMLAEVDVREEVRRILIREEIAAAEGLDEPIQTAALMQRYEQSKDQLATIELGFITVADQETADTVLLALVADPSSYAALAATYAGPNTAPEPISGALGEVPAQLLPSVQETEVGQGFTLPLPEAGGVVVGYVSALDVPTFADVRDQLRAEADDGVQAAVAELVTQLVADLEIDVNPRYGSFDQGRVVPVGDGGVVQILEGATTG